MRATLLLPPSITLIEAALEGLVAANVVLIETGIVPPSPLDARVRFKRERRGLEEWNLATVVIDRGEGDCEDLNGWETAGLRATGEDPGARLAIVQTGPRTFHAVVERSDGSLEDVCPALGMKPRETLDIAGLLSPIMAVKKSKKKKKPSRSQSSSRSTKRQQVRSSEVIRPEREPEFEESPFAAMYEEMYEPMYQPQHDATFDEYEPTYAYEDAIDAESEELP